MLLQTLKSKLQNFNQFLHRVDLRRGLVNFGETILKTMFRTATVSDIHKLHDVFNELHSRNSDFVHSFSNQLT